MKRPNILLITTDQQHYSMLGAVNKILKTPNLDKLASEGARMDRAYCPNPTCTPSRSSILTGMYPSHHGAWSLGTKLPEDAPTLSQTLRDNGYKTALIGKAHFQPVKSTLEYPSYETRKKAKDFDFWRNFNGEFYGFDHIEILRNHTAEHWVGHHYAMWMEDNGLKNWRDYFFLPTGKRIPRKKGRWKLPEKYHYNTFIAERSNAMLEEFKQEDKPFFLWASFPDPHYPQLAPEPWDKMYNPDDMKIPEFSKDEHKNSPPYFRECLKLFPNFRPYKGESGYGIHGLQRHFYIKSDLKKQLAYAYGMMSFTDKYIGKILDKLKELDLDRNTIIVFTTDHGDLFGQHGFRWKCIFHYEDLLKIPMIVKFPGKIPEHTSSESLQSLIDLAPTLLSLCDIPIPDCMDGVDQSKVWLGEDEKARDWIICENRHEPHRMNMRSYVEKRYKITVHENREYGELYDLKKDPEEHLDLWNLPEYADLKCDMLHRFFKAEIIKAKGEKIKTVSLGDYELTVDCESEEAKMFNLEADPQRTKNIWGESTLTQAKIQLLLRGIHSIMENEPMWMPRIASC